MPAHAAPLPHPWSLWAQAFFVPSKTELRLFAHHIWSMVSALVIILYSFIITGPRGNAPQAARSSTLRAAPPPATCSRRAAASKPVRAATATECTCWSTSTTSWCRRARCCVTATSSSSAGRRSTSEKDCMPQHLKNISTSEKISTPAPAARAGLCLPQCSAWRLRRGVGACVRGGPHAVRRAMRRPAPRDRLPRSGSQFGTPPRLQAAGVNENERANPSNEWNSEPCVAHAAVLCAMHALQAVCSHAHAMHAAPALASAVAVALGCVRACAPHLYSTCLLVLYASLSGLAQQRRARGPNTPAAAWVAPAASRQLRWGAGGGPAVDSSRPAAAPHLPHLLHEAR